MVLVGLSLMGFGLLFLGGLNLAVGVSHTGLSVAMVAIGAVYTAVLVTAALAALRRNPSRNSRPRPPARLSGQDDTSPD